MEHKTNNYVFYPFLVVFLLFFSFFPLHGAEELMQQRNVEIMGHVYDENNQPVIGASVTLKGDQTIGTISNIDGEFKLKVPLNSVLVITYIGYEQQEVKVSSEKTLSIYLKVSNNELDELVVVGYNTVKKANLTGAVSAINSDEMKSTVTSDVVNSLTGRLPGVRVAQFSSEPGTYDTDIDIRGFGTPLIIIDGVERSKEEFSRMTANEIESISVLKDASAAIYGVKAANGVLLVTTKEGTNSRPIVSYSFRLGMQQVTQFMETASAYDYAMMGNEKRINRALAEHSFQKDPDAVISALEYSPEYFEGLRNGSIQSYNILDDCMKKSAFQHSHDLSIRGGNERTKYFLAASYFKDNGLFRTGDLTADKYNFRFNISNKFAEGLYFKVNVGYMNSLNERVQNSIYTVFDAIIRRPPTYPTFANDNPLYLNRTLLNLAHPLAMVDRDKSGFNDMDEKYLQSNFELSYAIPYVPGLTAKVRYNYDFINKANENYRQPYNLYDYDPDKETYVPAVFQGPSHMYESVAQEMRDNWHLELSYAHGFGKHNVGAMILFEQRQNKYHHITADTDLALNGIPELNPGIAETDAVGSWRRESANQSWVGRLNYDWASKYLVDFSFRYDGSSKFPTDHRWGFFPSVSGAWRISEENFIKDNFSFVDNLKIRGSWGKLGDDGAADYQFLTGYNYPSGSGWMFGDTWTTGVGLRDIANPDITWYTSKTLDFGLDLSLWNSKLELTADLFWRTREGLLGYRTTTLPGYFGATLPQVNLNSDKTAGYEIEIGHKNKINDWRYGVRLNMSYTRTKQLDYEETPARDQYNAWRNTKSNRYTGTVWGYETDGVYTSFEDIAKGPFIDGRLNSSVLPGNPKFVDQNGDGIIDEKDKVALGTASGNKPMYYFALNFDLSYKDFDFRMLWQGGMKNMVRYTEGALYTPFPWDWANFAKALTDRWYCHDLTDPYNDASWTPGRYPATGEVKGPWRETDQAYFNANYFRLKNIEIGYTLPKKLLSKTFISNCRFYLNGYNLFTFTSGFSYLDPETNAGRGYSYPVTMNFNFGVDLTF